MSRLLRVLRARRAECSQLVVRTQFLRTLFRDLGRSAPSPTSPRTQLIPAQRNTSRRSKPLEPKERTTVPIVLSAEVPTSDVDACGYGVRSSFLAS